MLLICCNRMQRFDLLLCFSFTYLYAIQRRMVFRSPVYSQDIISRPRCTCANTAQHSHGTTPSIQRTKNNKRVDCGRFIDLWLSPTEPSCCPWSHHLFNFDTQWSASISTCESRWWFAERGSCCERAWPSAGLSGGAGGTNFNVTSFWEPHFKRLFLAGAAGNGRGTVQRCRGGTHYSTVQHVNNATWKTLNY